MLIVEDEYLIAMDAEVTLLEEGHDVVGIVGDEDEAVRAALAEQPDVILLDLRLARGGCGRRVAERLSGQTDAAFVFVSGNLTAEMRDKLAGLRPAGLLNKPYQPSQLLGALRQLV